MLPWPGRHERAAAIDAARQEKETSERRAAHARRVEHDIRQVAYESGNHWSVKIADSLGIDRPGRNGGQ